MTDLVYGIGINDRSKPARFDSTRMAKEYEFWKRMLRRCTQKYWDKFPTYKSCRPLSRGVINLTSRGRVVAVVGLFPLSLTAPIRVTS